MFTGYVVLRPIEPPRRGCRAQAVEGVLHAGPAQILQSDNGPEFVNATLRALVKLTGLDHRLISPYNPRADGKVERAIGSVMAIIKKLLHGSEATGLSSFLSRSSRSTAKWLPSRVHPFSLMFGRAAGRD